MKRSLSRTSLSKILIVLMLTFMVGLVLTACGKQEDDPSLGNAVPASTDNLTYEKTSAERAELLQYFDEYGEACDLPTVCEDEDAPGHVDSDT